MSRTPARWMDAFMTAAHWTWKRRYGLLLIVSCIAAAVLFFLASREAKAQWPGVLPRDPSPPIEGMRRVYIDGLAAPCWLYECSEVPDYAAFPTYKLRDGHLECVPGAVLVPIR